MQKFSCKLAAFPVAGLLFGLTSFSIAGSPNPPTEITRESYVGWLRIINSNISPFLDPVFAWYGEQIGSPLPAAVNNRVTNDPDKIYIVVDRAVREANDLENAAEVDQGNTFGFDTYGLADVPISVSLETALFYSGKPVGKDEGDTYPFGSLYSHSICSIQEKWGRGNYFSSQSRTGGGIAKDLHDDHTILVRGNAADGYSIFDSFYGLMANKSDTATISQISILLLKSRSDGKTEYRRSWRRNGQSYKSLGLENGRRLFGVEIGRFRSAEKVLAAAMNELNTTGRIKENRR
jgi:hypothetical protein